MSVAALPREALLAWFRANGPDYPWRRTEHDPYAVLVSEVMLQQTQASRVADAFPRFLTRFPDVRSLADASVSDVVRVWVGLGYNRRAVALRATARAIVDDHDGIVPSDVAVLRSFPGIGPYTAAAVSSIAFGTPIAAVDTNVRKVMARVALGRDAHGVPDATITDAAQRWLATDAPGDWNQAVMDLGRQLCRPVPRCGGCPLARVCRFRSSGTTGPRSGRRQPPFEGSVRQLRGAILRELTIRTRPISTGTLADRVGSDFARVRAAVEALRGDGLVEETPAGRVRLPG